MRIAGPRAVVALAATPVAAQEDTSEWDPDADFVPN